MSKLNIEKNDSLIESEINPDLTSLDLTSTSKLKKTPLTKLQKQEAEHRFKEDKKNLKAKAKAQKSFDKNQLEEEIDEQLSIQKKANFKEKVNKFGKQLNAKKIFKSFGKKTSPILIPFFIVMIVLVIIPIAAIIIYSIVQPTNDLTMIKVTLQNYFDLFTNGSIMLALGVTLLYALASSFLCILIGYPMALIMSQLRSKIFAKNIWLLVTLPMWISMIMKVLGLKSLFLILAPYALGTQVAIIIGMTYMFLPFAIPPIYDSLQSRQLDIEEAAQDLGCSKSKTFWTITLRSSMPGVITSFTLVILQAATSLIVVQYMGDGKINLISKIIESYFLKGSNFGAGAALSVIMAAIVLFLMMVSKYFSNKFEKKGGKKWEDSSDQVTLL